LADELKVVMAMPEGAPVDPIAQTRASKQPLAEPELSDQDTAMQNMMRVAMQDEDMRGLASAYGFDLGDIDAVLAGEDELSDDGFPSVPVAVADAVDLLQLEVRNYECSDVRDRRIGTVAVSVGQRDVHAVRLERQSTWRGLTLSPRRVYLLGPLTRDGSRRPVGAITLSFTNIISPIYPMRAIGTDEHGARILPWDGRVSDAVMQVTTR